MLGSFLLDSSPFVANHVNWHRYESTIRYFSKEGTLYVYQYSMSDTQKQKLEQQLWSIANTLRGKMGADDFRDYILGFIFYKYLSEKMHAYGC